MDQSILKSPDLIGELVSILSILSEVEVSGIPGVAVKCVDIRRNTGGEGDFLDQY